MIKMFAAETSVLRGTWRTTKVLLAALLVAGMTLRAGPAPAQSGGSGAISGTIEDSTGALIGKASVSALNMATGVETKRTASSDGLYNISPLIPGTYVLTVSATGFSSFRQENLVVDAMNNLGLNVTLKTGSTSQTVTVTDAPPVLESTNATLGGTIENSLYTALPVMISGSQQRDVTQFSNLLPGAQVNPGGRSSIIGGTGQRLGELYLDGLPITTLSQQGDNRPVFNIVPLEAIDQIKVVTTGFSAEYQGAGLENYNTKAGSNKYHGALFGYFRNTIFDAWSFSTKPGAPGNQVSVVDPVTGLATKVNGPKPAEHQTEFGYSVGGPISIPHLFSGHDKLFFFTTYDKFRSRLAVNPSASTVPTSLMRKGNFQELLAVSQGGIGGEKGTANAAPGYAIYDPTSQAACTAFNGVACRYQYGYTHGATPGSPQVPNGQPINVIPANQLSPITQYLQKFLPTPTIDTPGVIQNNYIGGIPSGYDNWLYSGRIDYVISQRQTLSMLLTGGNRHAVPYTATTANLPVPYLADTASIVGGHWADLEHTFILTPSLVNQFKFGFMNFGGPPVKNLTQGNPLYSTVAAGISGLPVGQASENFPINVFGGSNNQTQWAGPSTASTSVSETYTLKDNLQWVAGKHSVNGGFQYQWLENNASTADGASLPTTLIWSTNDTGNLSGSSFAANTGYSYASFLLGAVGGSTTTPVTVTQQPFSVLGGRFHPFAVYVQDDYKVLPKLTLNIGMRWDYIPTYREAQDRWSFLNPSMTNPITGNPGALQFAGNRGVGFSCGCRTPNNDYFKNFGPRLGFEYAVNEKTVVRGGWGILYSHAGGTGGAGGAATGTGQAGFNSSASFADSTAAPAFYLNSNPGFSAPNSNFGGPGFALAPPAAISAASEAIGTGFFVCSGQTTAPCNGGTGTSAGNGTSIAYPDPYLSGRAPEFSFFNFGMQREIVKDVTVTVNYVGSQTHFIAGAANIRGLQSGQLDPKYLVLGSNLTKAATAANIAAAQTATGITLPIPYAGYTAAAALNSNATIAHMLTWMPQYSGTSDPWGNVANANYNAFQLSVAKRSSHGLTFNINYTYSKNIDDAGTQRSGYAIPASANATGVAWAPNRMDRSLSVNSQPQNLSVYGVYQIPLGKGHLGGGTFIGRALLSGWETSHIFQYSSGLPLALTATCSTTQNVGQGTCMPDKNPNFTGDVRQNGGWGQGVTAATLGTRSYIKGALQSVGAGNGLGGTPCNASSGPFCDSSNYTVGDLGRIAPYGLRGPGIYRLTSALHRTFDITERAKFIFGVDCQNVTNHVTFGNNSSNNQIGVNVDSPAAFGTLAFASADPRAFQFSGRLTF
jgi:Carboxypeptidase regulatory-like domain/TonB dependent receptor